ncbi:MAG TPA: PIN domain-containing protein [Candidatus Acidoferrales bacterium]|nr:PIN domain-containing protein [Candidatus Acidoferrales bacterium]
MGRTESATSAAGRVSVPSLKKHDRKEAARIAAGHWPGAWVLRGALFLAFVLACIHFQPFELSVEVSALLGAGLALAVVLFQMQLERVSLRRLIGGAVGALVGLLGALLVSMVLGHTTMGLAQRSFTTMAVLLVLTYLGLAIGAAKGDMLNLDAFGGVFSGEPGGSQQSKVLDTSVIIDGRIADICAAQFLEGTLLIPQFVLRELQMVADSADPLKRQRGRRGLEILQRMQKSESLRVEIAEDDFPQIPDVDMKLIELAKRYSAKILTNDYNLNKVATLQGIDVLNINQLANVLKPVVLPGEGMRVFILREGKEVGQGVAYLDDGTMVVVDGARRMINRAVDITVTSVHQTTAGKMIFGKLEDRTGQTAPAASAAPSSQSVAEQPTATRGTQGGAEGRAPEGIANENAPRPVFPESGRS